MVQGSLGVGVSSPFVHLGDGGSAEVQKTL